MSDIANPQGKASLTLLKDWEQCQPTRAVEKTPADLLYQYFISVLILSANFRFKPVIGNQYFLYFRHGNWNVSLIAPAEWGTERHTDFIGVCELLPDMTWSFSVAAKLSTDSKRFILNAYESFLAKISASKDLETSLPIYEKTMSYYSRLYSAGLSSSLKKSLQLSGLSRRRGLDWVGQAPALPYLQN